MRLPEPGTSAVRGGASLGQARAFVQGVLGERWPGLDDVLLMVSEIASNALRHTASGDGSGFDLAVSVAAHTTRVAVTDRGSSSEPRIPDHGGGPPPLPRRPGAPVVCAPAPP